VDSIPISLNSGNGLDSQLEIAFLLAEEASKHKANPLNIIRLQVLRAISILALVDRLELPPREIHRLLSTVKARDLKISLPIDTARLTVIILQHKSVFLAIAGTEDKLNAVIGGEVEVEFGGGALGGEARTAEGLSVQVAGEDGHPTAGGELRIRGASADAVVGGGPVAGVPGLAATEEGFGRHGQVMMA